MKQYSEEQLKILVGVAVILKEDYYKIDKNRFSFKKLRTVVDLGEEVIEFSGSKNFFSEYKEYFRLNGLARKNNFSVKELM